MEDSFKSRNAEKSPTQIKSIRFKGTHGKCCIPAVAPRSRFQTSILLTNAINFYRIRVVNQLSKFGVDKSRCNHFERMEFGGIQTFAPEPNPFPSHPDPYPFFSSQFESLKCHSLVDFPIKNRFVYACTQVQTNQHQKSCCSLLFPRIFCWRIRFFSWEMKQPKSKWYSVVMSRVLSKSNTHCSCYC